MPLKRRFRDSKQQPEKKQHSTQFDNRDGTACRKDDEESEIEIDMGWRRRKGRRKQKRETCHI